MRPVARPGVALAPWIHGDRHHNSAFARAQGRAASVGCLPKCPPCGFEHARIAGASLRVGRCCGSLGNRQRRWSGREDLNLRPHRPERCALPGCATPRGKPEYRRPTHHPTQGRGPVFLLPRLGKPTVFRVKHFRKAPLFIPLPGCVDRGYHLQMFGDMVYTSGHEVEDRDVPSVERRERVRPRGATRSRNVRLPPTLSHQSK